MQNPRRELGNQIATTTVVLLLVCSFSVVPTTTASTQSTLVVSEDGDAEYETIQAAVDAASTGDVIEVRPGEYNEQVVIDKTIAILASDGATLDGSSLGGDTVGIRIVAESGAEPVIEGITIEQFHDGFEATDTGGDWVIRNATISNNDNDGLAVERASGAWVIQDSRITDNGDEGIDAENTTGPWRITGTTVARNGDTGIDADGRDSTGSWTIRDSVIRQNNDDGLDLDLTRGDWAIYSSLISENRAGIQAIKSKGDWLIQRSIIRNNSQIGVNALSTSGDWTINESTLRFNRLSGVGAQDASGNWRIQNTLIENSSVGVQARRASGSWRIEHSAIRDNKNPRFDLVGEGNSIYAVNMTGEWKVHNSSFGGYERYAIDASGAKPPGDATYNWWGDTSSAVGETCTGNVDCSNSLSSPTKVENPPTVSPDYDIGTASPKDDGLPVNTRGVVLVVGAGVCLSGALFAYRRFT